MRIDKFLKISRLVKRRTLAQEKISLGAVRINGIKCKPSKAVETGDVLEIAYTSRVLKVEVLLDIERELKKKGAQAYKLLSETRVDPDTRPW